jgi:hypothetical protein
MYSPRVRSASHTMNKQTDPLHTLVKSLTDALMSPSRSGGKKTKRNKKRKSKLSKNPSARNPGARDNQLDLTRSQFTATSPLNLFTVATGSTPGGIRVKGRELISSAVTAGALTGAFTLVQITGLTNFPLNPSNFPRLSAYAPIYEFYKFHKADILFQANQPTTATGEVLVSVDYDAKDNAPANSIAMMRNISATMANIYSDCSLQILGSLSRIPRFVTGEQTSPDLDQVTQAEIYVAVEGVTAAAGASLGYIIVQYDIEFYTPQ